MNVLLLLKLCELLPNFYLRAAIKPVSIIHIKYIMITLTVQCSNNFVSNNRINSADILLDKYVENV